MADTSLSGKKIGLLVWQVSNHWQSKLRNILKEYNLTLNEYLILESIYLMKSNNNFLSQKLIATFASIDTSVVSVTLKSMEKKKLIIRSADNDNRKKKIEMLIDGKKLIDKIYPKIEIEENIIFEKLQNEKVSFINSLKLILGKKIRIKVDKKMT